MRRLLVGTAALATLIACAGGGDSSTGSDEVINGSRDTDANDSVVLVISPADTAGYINRCTGTVVAPNLILTARHCVSRTDASVLCRPDGTAKAGGRVYSDKNVTDIKIYTGVEADDDTKNVVAPPRPGRADRRARGKQLLVEETDTYCSHDVAFIVLDRDLDVPVAPIRLSGGARKGEALTAVGWGITEVGKSATERKVRENIPVLNVGPMVAAAGGSGISASEFMVGESICQGDSGGPSFSAAGAVVGVVSRGGNGMATKDDAASGCSGSITRNIYTHLAQKLDLVTKAFEAAGHQPVLETPLQDAGTDASAPTDAGAEDVDAGEEAPVENAPVAVKEPGAGATVSPQPIATSAKEGCSAAPGAADGGWLIGLVALAFGRRRRRSAQAQ